MSNQTKSYILSIIIIHIYRLIFRQPNKKLPTDRESHLLFPHATIGFSQIKQLSQFTALNQT